MKIHIIGCVALLVAVLLAAPAAHDLHDSTDSDCLFCQLRQGDTAVLVTASAFAMDFEQKFRRDSTSIGWVESSLLLAAQPRAPPA